MHNSACCVKAVHTICLQWQTVIPAEGLIILHVIHAVHDLKFNI